jgi:hypothetical protein
MGGGEGGGGVLIAHVWENRNSYTLLLQRMWIMFLDGGRDTDTKAHINTLLYVEHRMH